MEGFERGRNLEKIGQHAQDTAELSFADVRVPAENLLGEEGEGFRYLVSNLPQERLSIAASAVAAAEAALGWTLEYVRERQAFGQPIGSFQNSRFTLAELAREIADRARVRRPLRAGAERRRARRPRTPRWPSGGAPTCRAASSTAACSCTAATATCSSTRSPAPSPTRA